MSQKDKPPKESDDDECNGSGESGAHHAPQDYHYQLEMVREVLKRMIKLSCLSHDDLRAGTTSATFQIAIAILERTVELREKLRVAERQLQIAKKAKMKRNSEALQDQLSSWNRMCTELEELVTETVMGIFMNETLQGYSSSNSGRIYAYHD
jgi:hypothetical protein